MTSRDGKRIKDGVRLCQQSKRKMGYELCQHKAKYEVRSLTGKWFDVCERHKTGYLNAGRGSVVGLLVSRSNQVKEIPSER